MAKENRRFYKTVPPNTREIDEFTPDAGTAFFITGLGGNAGPNIQTSVKIYFDFEGASEELLFSTHNDMEQVVSIERVPDGTKKIAIVLTNDTLTPTEMGGYWNGED